MPRADLKVLDPLKAKAGVVAIEEMGGPVVPWREGRTDGKDETSCPPDGRLPDAAQGAQHVRDIFYRMGFNDKEIVALLGAHAVGRCHPNEAGFTGPWTNAPTTFSNEFFRLLLEEKWTVDDAVIRRIVSQETSKRSLGTDRPGTALLLGRIREVVPS